MHLNRLGLVWSSSSVYERKDWRDSWCPKARHVLPWWWNVVWYLWNREWPKLLAHRNPFCAVQLFAPRVKLHRRQYTQRLCGKFGQITWILGSFRLENLSHSRVIQIGRLRRRCHHEKFLPLESTSGWKGAKLDQHHCINEWARRWVWGSQLWLFWRLYLLYPKSQLSVA